MKVFVSQPMSGKTRDAAEHDRAKAIAIIEELYPDEPLIVVNPIDSPSDAVPIWLLGESLELLSSADLAFFCKDWYKDRACSLQHMACAKYGIDTAYYNQKTMDESES